MSKLSPLKPAQVIRKLRKLGFIGPIPGGRHARMVHPEKGKIIPIPMHKGGGLTLLARMLRRHPQVVSVTGDHRYWSGADEMHTVFGPILPSELTGTRYKVPWPDHPVYKPPRSWTYACDELLPLLPQDSEGRDAGDQEGGGAGDPLLLEALRPRPEGQVRG